MSTALTKKGIPRPKEYRSSIITPSSTFPWLVASIKADPRKAPTQGVHPMEKTIPNKTEEKNPRLSVLASFVPLEKGKLKNAKKIETEENDNQTRDDIHNHFMLIQEPAEGTGQGA